MLAEKWPIRIKEREIQATQPSPVITYKLSKEELEEHLQRLGLKKKDTDKPIILGDQPNKKMGVENMEDKKQPKKLTVEELEGCLQRGMTEEQIAREYEKDVKIVKMLIARHKNKNKPARKEAQLKIISLKGLLEYQINHENRTVFMKCTNNEDGNAAIGVVSMKDIPKLIEELQQLQKIISRNTEITTM